MLLSYSIEEIETAIGTIKKSLSSMEEAQHSINSNLSTFQESFTTTGSKNVFERLNSFVSMRDRNSSLSVFLEDIRTKISQIETALVYLKNIDTMGS